MGVKISALPTLANLTSTSTLPVVSAGTTYQVSANSINNYITSVMSTSNVTTTGNVSAANYLISGNGTPTVSSPNNLDLSAPTAVRITGGGTFRLPSLTTAQISNLVPVNGDMVYNSTTARIQAYAGNVWGNITLS